jgi:hypothetical protein
VSLLAGSLAQPLVASASEPRSLTEPDVLQRPAQVVDVVDAFGDRGGVDVHFTLGYQQSSRHATVQRESQPGATSAVAPGGVVSSDVAAYSESISRLNVRSELGLYKDLALVVQVPVVLSLSRSLAPTGSALSADPGLLQGAPGQALFVLPFNSPNRSGVEYLGVGIDWGIFNQFRNPDQPNVLVGVEARFSVSEPMHACGRSGGGVACAYPSDINRDGNGMQFPFEPEPGSTAPLEGRFSGTRKAGVGRGTTGFRLHAATSRRYQHVEPYAAFEILYEVENEDSDFPAGKFWNAGLPVRGALSVGAELMPWEVVEQFQRFSLDVRLKGTITTSGVDYSELFDALGSSAAASLRAPNFAAYKDNPDAATSADFPSVVDGTSERVFVTGLTQVETHAAGQISLTASWQAGRYVQFDVGGALGFTQAHLLTVGEPCDSAVGVSVGAAGPCLSGAAGQWQVEGRPDPSYRPEISLPGRRFRVDTARMVDGWVSATVMF